MSQKNVKSTAVQQWKPQFFDPFFHFFFGILIDTWAVTHGTAQPQNTDAFVDIDLIFDTDTSVRRCLFVPVIVISPYIQDRRRGKSGEKRQIVRVQISAREDQIDPLEFLFLEVIPEIFGFFVCNC